MHIMIFGLFILKHKKKETSIKRFLLYIIRTRQTLLLIAKHYKNDSAYGILGILGLRILGKILFAISLTKAYNKCI